jgi:hypothetical protein
VIVGVGSRVVLLQLLVSAAFMVSVDQRCMTVLVLVVMGPMFELTQHIAAMEVRDVIVVVVVDHAWMTVALFVAHDQLFDLGFGHGCLLELALRSPSDH